MLDAENILCVGEEPHVAAFRCEVLRAAGFEAAHATSLREAISMLERDSYEVVITDWRLVDGGGELVVRAARCSASTPAVLVCGYIAEAGGDFVYPDEIYLEKPVGHDELIGLVNELLKRRANRAKTVPG